ncbi:hypothetical protein AB0A76_18320 [Streptomyces exfoliatus]|uniref:Uncharacterized protein n=1 Tax=Streptomyces exfoliatus TaxID=1905 RepID=A0ABV3CY51_STREX
MTAYHFKHLPLGALPGGGVATSAVQIAQTNKRWISPTHPDGHGLAIAEKILDAAHKHLCRDF